ncbi:phosphoglucomutase/phosphomannomutase PgmG [Novosphingobium sp. EMRT-2]|uniref:phosphoglucomutase/phosphomannomutase PgmG n=1 Tax=Novosphingobium sp. EMRT-2 TaxID=2571749 RepID=UPI0010BDB87E|nr:phosphomannomutase/phosphoglucomutase [Novosphingobium sp. EMRT-2]QCI94266.1 phosphomannomutase/phosphoglucomutase [Novosphingobium sp. EMRT-2]
MTHRFPPSILREYDIRGVVGQTLGEADARAIGQTFGTRARAEAEAHGASARIVVGRDGRLSSPALEQALVEGLLSAGVDAVRIGLCPTPMLYFAEATLDGVTGGIQVTGSHNPADQNGFKFVLRGRPFFGEAIAELASMAQAGNHAAGTGQVTRATVIDSYVATLLAALDGIDPAVLDGLRIGWDAGNGAAGPVIDRLVERLPGFHVCLHTAVDGRFPNHHPDPTVEANLDDLRDAVAAHALQFGVAFDGDGDRIGVVDSVGRVIWGDQLMMIFAEDVLQQHPGAAIVADVKASNHLFARIRALGGQAHMWKTGHSLIKSRMAEIGAPLGGEMTGHICFADSYFGFDDALYAAIRLIAATVRLGRSVTALRGAMPESVTTPELRIPVAEERKFAVIAEVMERLRQSGATVESIDGARVTTPDGWWLLRASNTQAALTARAESDDAEGLARLLDAIDAQLAASGVAREAGLP